MSNAIESASASEQVRNAFNFSIDKFPLQGPDGMRTPWYGLFRSDNGEVVGDGSVTNRYLPHQTDDVVALVEACESVFDKSSGVSTYFRDGHYVTVAPSKEYRRQIFGTNDNVFPRLIIRGGYDRSAFSVTLGVYRDVCDNLAIIRDVAETHQAIRHTSGLREKMDELVGQFRVLKNGWSNLTDAIVRMQESSVSMVDFLNQVYPQPELGATDRAVAIHRNRTEAIFRRLRSERWKTQRPSIDNTFTVSAWEAFNAVQGYVQHDATRRRSHRGSFQRILMASKDPHVIKAEQLALSA